MYFEDVHRKFEDSLSIIGTVGTQTTIPFEATR